MIPYTVDRREDTGVTNVTMGVWLFLASEVMLFGALFSAYALLRVSAPTWPAGGDVLGVRMALVNTLVLVSSTALLWRAARRSPVPATHVLISTLLAVAFLALKAFEYHDDFTRGLVPAASTFLAMYFVLTGLHALHVAGGAIANAWLLAGRTRVDPRLTSGRAHALALYWLFVDVVWLVIFPLFYL
jgi:heme/copper-type cytochrome/quinol oxidase subunit 3